MRPCLLILLSSFVACVPTGSSKDFLIGAWFRSETISAGFTSFVRWEFRADETFLQTGYPPLTQQGRYRILESDNDLLKIRLFEQSGTFGTDDRDLMVQINRARNEITLAGTVFPRAK